MTIQGSFPIFPRSSKLTMGSNDHRTWMDLLTHDGIPLVDPLVEENRKLRAMNKELSSSVERFRIEMALLQDRMVR